MSLFGLFKKKSDETKVGNVEDFISLTRVYFQSVIATNLGITNMANWDWQRNRLHAKC